MEAGAEPAGVVTGQVQLDDRAGCEQPARLEERVTQELLAQVAEFLGVVGDPGGHRHAEHAAQLGDHRLARRLVPELLVGDLDEPLTKRLEERLERRDGSRVEALLADVASIVALRSRLVADTTSTVCSGAGSGVLGRLALRLRADLVLGADTLGGALTVLVLVHVSSSGVGGGMSARLEDFQLRG